MFGQTPSTFASTAVRFCWKMLTAWVGWVNGFNTSTFDSTSFTRGLVFSSRLQPRLLLCIRTWIRCRDKLNWLECNVNCSFLPHMNHVSVSPTNGNWPTQGQRKTLTRVGIEPTTFGLNHPCSTEWAIRSYGIRSWELIMLKSRQWTCTSTRKGYVFANVGRVAKNLWPGWELNPQPSG